MVEVRPDPPPVLGLERVEPELCAVSVETDGLGRSQTCSQLRPALGQPSVVDHDEVAGTLLQCRRAMLCQYRPLRNQSGLKRRTSNRVMTSSRLSLWMAVAMSILRLLDQ